MNLEFHPEAHANFAEKGRCLGESSLLEDPQQAPSPPPGFPIDPYVEERLTEEDIRSIDYWSQMDMGGDERARYYPAEGQVLSLEGERYEKFRKLAGQMRDTNTLRSKVALATVMDALGRWLLGTELEEIDEPMPAFVLRECEDEIYEHTVYVPVFQLFMEAPLNLGRVSLRPVPRSRFDEWSAQMKEQGYEPETISAWTKRWQRRMQGQVAAVMTVDADRKLAYQLARQEAQRTVEVLRIYSPAMLHPRIRSFCALRGTENLEEHHGVIIRDGEVMSESGFIDPVGAHWRLSKKKIDKFREAGLNDFNALLRVESPTKFQGQILEAVRIYSRAALEGDQTEQLLHIFVALESLLLRNTSEPISTNIAERVAFLVRQDARQRKAVAQAVRDAYGSRSGYVHHAKRIEEPDKLVDFMRYTWEFFIGAARHHDQFENKQDFISAIETVKFQ